MSTQTHDGSAVCPAATAGRLNPRPCGPRPGTMVLSACSWRPSSPWWLLLTGFVGVNLLQSSVTGFCPAALVFRRFGSSGLRLLSPLPAVR